ncbi:Outer membrane protein A precursor [Collimonas arenae]|uniref:Outer membrane protein A n=1 Tax=Collimonas arenae TaxID=279058 RepID=A0A0A1FDR4_9BURK|nr:OmpA family protein [Collimonas arenae]AIY42888.1 Outer membrane protein A precursor [Collimonas arenae]
MPAQATPAPGGTVIRNVATATYVPAGFAQTETASSNGVIANVLPVEALTLTQDQNVTRPPNVVVSLNHLLTNTGNVPSSYTLNFVNNGPGCVADTLDLSSLRIVRDMNNNGVVDASDSVIALGSVGALQLKPGETASLIVQGTTPSVASGTACLTLSATTVSKGQSAVNHNVVTVGNVAVMSLIKSASYPSLVQPGSTVINFVVSGTNIGSQDAAPTSTAVPGSNTIIVNGAPKTLVLLRDLVPAGTQYIAGSLQSTALGAIRLFRLPGDPAFSYRTTDDASAIEVAIGIPAVVARNASIALQFSAKVNPDQTGNILNNAQSYYNDGTASTQSLSNTVVIPVTPARIGIAKAASTPQINLNAAGVPDGTATVQFSLRIKNYGSTWLYDVQATDLLEGSGSTQFGSYTASAAPAVNQYTIVPGSLVMANSQGNAVTGTVAAANQAFTGASATASAQNLLAPGAVLPVGGEFTVQFAMRVNLSGRTGTLLNTSRAQAALAPGAPPSVFDDSVNGTDPAPGSDGNPNNYSSPTPVSTQLPVLTLVKTASLPRRVAQGVYDIDYTFGVTNSGTAPAPYVRLIDNLNCTFDMDLSTGSVASWQITAPPKAANGLLAPAASFTGNAICNRAAIASASPYNLPTEAVLSLTDGSRALAPAQSEQVTFTVRVTEKPNLSSSRVTVNNKGWAAAYSQNTINLNPSMLVAAASSTVQSLLMDPQGTIYNAVTRQPVAGALVTYTRQSCTSGSATPITSAEIYGGASGVYTFNANGSVSMQTGGDGAYSFYLQSPPVNSMCTYVISVTPPAGSGYVVPSQLIPATSGIYTQCGMVVPGSAVPQNGDPTTYYFSVRAGVNPATGAICDAEHDDIPMDPGNIQGLILKKDGSKSQAELGDFVDYALTLTNKTGVPVTGVTFNDVLPPGFAYVAGSARLNGVASPDPAGGAGPHLVFSYPNQALAVDQVVMVRYRLRIGVGAPTSGDAINRANASSGPLKSNQASWRVHVSGGVFADDAYAFGKVYMDCKRDGMQSGSDEIGVPGVRLYMEDGTNVVTDVEGKWSLYGLKPITHVLRVDETTLPPGARLAVLDNRNANNPASRFVDLKKGEFHKANFIIQNCEAPGVMDDVMARRKLVASRPDADGEAAVRVRLDPTGKPVAVGDTRSLPAAGQIGTGGATGSTESVSQPLIQLPSAPAGGSNFIGSVGGVGTLNGTLGDAQQAGAFAPLSGVAGGTSGLLPGGVGSGVGTIGSNGPNSHGTTLQPAALPLLPQAAPTAIELETLLPTLDNKAGFIGLKDHDTVATQSINVRVKGQSGLSLRLTVNGEAIDGRRVGKKAVLASKNLAAWEYIGVVLNPGENALQLDLIDEFGNARGTEKITVTAPDKLGKIQIDVPTDARADLRTPVLVKVRLTDANGVPVTARTQLTLESDRGRWLEQDLNHDEPGTQVFMDGGQAEFHLLPPGEPGSVRIRVSAGAFVNEVRLALLPAMRPMIGVGIVEATLDFSNRGQLTLGQMPAGAAFETELSGMVSSDTSDTRAAGRAAFYFKGAVKGDFLLTAAYDSAKTGDTPLFRDIQPDQFYPVYGDSSARGFDAQSTQKLYVRIDKNHSYLLYGDFTTASSGEVRQLSQSNRTLTGLKDVYETDKVRATSYASRTSQTQQIQEFPAQGISGPYYLSAGTGDLLTNSAIVEILVRDRNQPNTVLQITQVTQFVDYTIEPLTKRLLFTRPISAVDSNLNPQSIRVTYEIDSGGPKFTVAGTDVQVKVGDKLQVGVVASTDENPDNRRKLGALTAIARVGSNTTVAGELVKTDTDLNGEGKAGRIELRHQDGDLGVVAQYARTTATFDNPGSTFSAGQTEAVARAEYKIDDTTHLRGEAIYSKNAATPGDIAGTAVSIQKKLSNTLVGEAGLRYGQNSSPTASMFDYNQVSSTNGALGSANTASPVTTLGAAAAGTGTNESLTTVRGRLSSQVPGLPQAQVFVEGEQDLAHGDRHMLAVGGNYAITDKTRLYGRYEVLSNLDGPYTASSTDSHNVAVFGVESNYMEGGRVYNEYRLADSLDGRAGQAAVGVRNTFKVSEHVRATAGIERTTSSGASSPGIVGLGNATAIVSGLEYQGERVKASGVLEARQGDDANTLLSSAGFGYKINDDWSFLARSIISNSKGQGTNNGNNSFMSRQQIGAAYRPVNQDVWNALMRYEHKVQRTDGTGATTGAITDISFGTGTPLPGVDTADIISASININPQRGTYITGRYAGKVSSTDDGTLKSTYWAHLLQGRYTRDLNKDWDVGLQAGLMFGQGGSLQKTAGIEVGYLLAKDLWLSVGYNVVGLSDRDLTAGEYTSKGAYIRLRFKFDETALGFPSAGAVSKPAPVPAAPAPEPVTAVPEPVEAPPPVKTTFQSETLFDFGKAVIKPTAHVALDQFAERIRNADYEVVVTIGHTDSVGSDSYNQKLSVERAEAVRAYLITQGIDASRIKAEGRGANQPLASNATPEGRAQNRRVEIEVTEGGTK